MSFEQLIEFSGVFILVLALLGLCACIIIILNKVSHSKIGMAMLIIGLIGFIISIFNLIPLITSTFFIYPNVNNQEILKWLFFLSCSLLLTIGGIGHLLIYKIRR